jgi:hypothetical protein
LRFGRSRAADADIRQVQFAVPDGQVTITCTRALDQATITHQ